MLTAAFLDREGKKYEGDDIEVMTTAKMLNSDQTEWVRDNLTPGNQDFSIGMTVGRNKQPSVWVYRANGTTLSNDKEVTVQSAPGFGDRSAQLLRGTASECVVYKIVGKRIVVCW